MSPGYCHCHCLINRKNWCLARWRQTNSLMLLVCVNYAYFFFLCPKITRGNSLHHLTSSQCSGYVPTCHIRPEFWCSKYWKKEPNFKSEDWLRDLSSLSSACNWKGDVRKHCNDISYLQLLGLPFLRSTKIKEKKSFNLFLKN